MGIPDEQAATAAFLAGLAGAAPSETHISAVFVGEDTVWKLKKAVRLPFLDFTDPAARRRFAERELALNQPAAPGLYRDVVAAIRRPDGSIGFGCEGEAIDWVLRMARVPPGDFFDRIAGEGRLTAALLDGLADAVADYHAGLAPGPGRDGVARTRRSIASNAAAASGAGLAPGIVAAWQAQAEAALAAMTPALEARHDRVRRAHGDLHLGNLCLWQGRPVPFDALEFDEEMATIDLGYDLAFLLMDVEQHAGRAAANRLLNRYVDRTGDAGLTAPLPLFLSLRAFIRAHVEASSDHPDAAGRYLRAAIGHLRPAPAVVIAIGGLPGTGKSSLARALAPGIGRGPGALVLRSDTIRKRRHGVLPEQRLPPGAYGKAANAAVSAELAALTGAVAAGGQAVIADATFLDRADQARIAASGAPFLGVWLEAPLAELERRVAARTGDASDATPDLLRRMAANAPARPAGWLAVPAADLDAACRRVLEELALLLPAAAC